MESLARDAICPIAAVIWRFALLPDSLPRDPHASYREDRPGPIRLGGIGNVYASSVAASRRVYVSDLDGNTMVLSHEEKPRELALNHLNDVFAASAAIVGHELFLRGERFLYCISEEDAPNPK